MQNGKQKNSISKRRSASLAPQKAGKYKMIVPFKVLCELIRLKVRRGILQKKAFV